MKLSTTKTVIATVLAATFAGLSLTAIAQNTATPTTAAAERHAQHMGQRGHAMTPERMAQMQQRHTERHAQRMESLKAELKITPAQEAAWSAFTARTAHSPRMSPPAAAAAAPLTTPQRLDAMQAQHAERGAQLAQRIDATKALYAQLTPEQQKTFDTLGGGFQRAGMKGQHRHGGKGGKGGHDGHGRHGMGGGMGHEGGAQPAAVQPQS